MRTLKMLIYLFLCLSMALSVGQAQASVLGSIKNGAKRLFGLESAEVKNLKAAAKQGLRPLTAKGNEFIGKYGTDLTALAAVGRLDSEADQFESFQDLLESLNTGHSVNVQGSIGTGRLDHINKLAVMTARRDPSLPVALRDKRYIRLNFWDMANLGGDNSAMRTVMNDLIQALDENPNMTLVLDNFDDLLNENLTDDAYKVIYKGINEIIKRQKVKNQVILVTEPGAFKNAVEGKHSALANTFRTVNIKEPNLERSLEILMPEVDRLTRRHGVRFPMRMIITVAKVAREHYKQLPMPESAKRILQRIASNLDVQKLQKPSVIPKLETKINALKMERKSLEGLDGAYYVKQAEELESQIAKAEAELDTISQAWEKTKPRLERYHDSLAYVQKQSSLLHHAADTMIYGSDAARKNVDLKRVTSEIDELITWARNYQSQYPDDISDQVIEQLQAARQAAGFAKEGPIAIKDIAEMLDDFADIKLAEIYADAPQMLKTEVDLDAVIEGAIKASNGSIDERMLRSLLKSESFADELEEFIAKKFVGQKRAVQALVRGMEQHRLEGSSPGYFLFIGPSRTGKSYLAELIGAYQGRNGHHQLNGADYYAEHMIAKAEGAPAGYTGFEQGGEVPNFSRRNPYGVLIIDEFDRAYPGFGDYWLKYHQNPVQVDTLGREIDYSNNVFVFTSNVLEDLDPQVLEGLNPEEYRNTIIRLIRAEKPDFYSEPFLNRMLDIIHFNRFSESEKLELFHRTWEKMLVNIMKKSEMKIDISDDVMDALARMTEGGNAAQVRALIDREIMNRITSLKTMGKVSNGHIIEINLNKGSELIFRIIRTATDSEEITLSTLRGMEGDADAIRQYEMDF